MTIIVNTSAFSNLWSMGNLLTKIHEHDQPYDSTKKLSLDNSFVQEENDYNVDNFKYYVNIQKKILLDELESSDYGTHEKMNIIERKKHLDDCQQSKYGYNYGVGLTFL
jgi:hypothetical protein